MTENIKYSLVGKPGDRANNGLNLFDSINFMPIQECPFFKFQPANTITSTMTELFTVKEEVTVEKDTKNWDAVLVTVIPAILIACLVSTCYLCYRWVPFLKLKTHDVIRRQNYAIILVRNVSRRGSSLRRKSSSKRSRDLERETEMLRQQTDNLDHPKVSDQLDHFWLIMETGDCGWLWNLSLHYK